MTSEQILAMAVVAEMNTNVVVTQARLQAMKAQNDERDQQGKGPAYGSDAFFAVEEDLRSKYNDAKGRLEIVIKKCPDGKGSEGPIDLTPAIGDGVRSGG